MAIVYVETRSKNLPDSGAWQIHKFGTASGEQRIAIEGSWTTDKKLFDFYVKDVEFYFFTKSDMLEYISSIQEEIHYPTQEYYCKDYPAFYEEKKKEIVESSSNFMVTHFKANPRIGGTAYLASVSAEDSQVYNFLRSICLSSKKQGKKNAYTTLFFIKYQDTKTGKYYINLVPKFTKQYTMEELSIILKRTLEDANDVHVAMSLFGLKYAEIIISGRYSCYDLINSIGYEDSNLIKTLETALQVYQELKEKEITINPIADKQDLLGAYIESNISKANKNSENIQPSLPLQQIHYGAPGTGKSCGIKKIIKEHNIDEKTQVIRTTFHPDSDYSTFVGAYKPTMEYPNNKAYTVGQLIDKLSEIKNTGCTYPCQKFAAKYWYALKQLSATEIKEIISACGFTDSMKVEIDKSIPVGEELAKNNKDSKIVYSFVPQAFLKAYVAAWKNLNEEVFLVIEEINRGNCAQIFGDIFQLLDRKDNGESEYPIKADQDIQDYLAKEFAGVEGLEDNIQSGEELMLPANLHIWATMNTSDQSLFPIDSAFKRRWDWEYVPIVDAGKNWKIKVGETTYDWWKFIEAINEQINTTTSSEDKKIGYFFCKPCEGDNILATKFVNKVIFYLWNDVFKDYELPDAFKKADGHGHMSFNDFYTKQDECIHQLMKNLKVKPDGQAEEPEVIEEPIEETEA